MVHGPFALLFAASAVGSMISAVILGRRRRSTSAAGAMTVTMLGAAWWSGAKLLSLVATDLPAKLAFELAIYPGVCATVAGFFCYSLAVADRAWALSARTAALLTAGSALVIGAAFTNPWHHLFLADGRLVGSPPTLAYEPGPLFWLHTAYSYALLGCAVLTILRAYLHAPHAYRRRFVFPLLAFVPPCFGNIVTLTLLPEGKTAGLTPVFFSISAAACGWALLRQALPDVVPVAGRLILETISDAVVVVDRDWRVLDANPAADRLVRRVRPSAPDPLVGCPAGDLLGVDPAVTDAEHTLTTPAGERIDLSVRVGALHDRAGRVMGWVLVGHDDTERNRQRHELHRANAKLREQLSAVERLRAELAEQAVRDALTGLHNRRHLIDALGREVDLARSGDRPLSVVVIDIDHFKQINDQYGHSVGDEVIATVAARLAAATRDGETVARYGGEEFVLVLPGCSVAEAARRAEALRTVCDATPMTAHGHALPVTISAGAAQLRPGDGIGALIDAADRALYTAKTLGRNRVEVAPRAATGPAVGPAAAAGPVAGPAAGAVSAPRQPVDPAHLLVGQ